MGKNGSGVQSRQCGFKYRLGSRCTQLVADWQDHCRAGHPCVPVKDRWPATKQQLLALANNPVLREEPLRRQNGLPEAIEQGSYETEELHCGPVQSSFVCSASSSVLPGFQPDSREGDYAQSGNNGQRQRKALRATGEAAVFGAKALLKTAGFLLDTLNPFPTLLGDDGSGGSGRVRAGAAVVATRRIVRDHGRASSRKVPEGTLGFVSGVSPGLLGDTYSITWQTGLVTSQVRASEVGVVAAPPRKSTFALL